MNGASKILTVSYGTFSCTLEGFDDPFNTMKAIAEYFRDLAAEDRYFGAEPPQPDAAMLHRIAEREVQRRVEAKLQGNGVILRADDATSPAPLPETAARPDLSMAPVAPIAETVAEKLSRLRKAAADQHLAALTQSPSPPISATASMPFFAFEEEEGEPLLAAEPQDAMPSFDESVLAAPVSAPVSEIAAQDPVAPDAAVQPSPLSQDQDLLPEDIPLIQPEAAWEDLLPEQSPSAESDIDDALLASLMALDTAPAPEPVAEPTVNAAEDAALLAGLNALIDPPEADLPTAPSAEMPTDSKGSDQAPPLLQGADPTDTPEAGSERGIAPDTPTVDAPVVPVRPVRRVRSLRPAEVDAAKPARPATPPPAASDTGADPATDAAEATLADAESRTPITAEKLQRARARVIKIRRNDAGVAPTSAAQTEQPPASAASAKTETAVPADLATPAVAAARGADGRFAAGDVAVSRLMDEASSQMDVPDTRRRMSAIAHLKAAVAATIAERRATGSSLSDNGSQRMGAYRNDLAAVVRPHGAAEPVGPAASLRPAPLVLVSEQRIDRYAPMPDRGGLALDARPVENVQPVRPRRAVAASPVPAFAEVDQARAQPMLLTDAAPPQDRPAGTSHAPSEDFSHFAERLGATDLAQLLEAAAAYIVCVENLDSFTRPHLMRHLDTAIEGLSREDGLRIFGVLLRDGVIERSRRGQFALNAASPLLAEARKITV